MCLAAAGWAAALALGGCGPEEPAAVAEPGASAAEAPPVESAPAEPTETAEPPPPVERDWPAAALRTGGAVEAALDRGQGHLYDLPLQAGQLLRLQVEQHGVDVELRLRSPRGELLLVADRLINDRGPELVLAVAEQTGTHSLEIRAFPTHGPGRYEARIDALRAASADDRLAAATYRSFREAEDLPRGEAVEVWNRALATWRALGELALEAEVLARLGRDRYDHADYASAAELYRAAADAFARAGDRRWEARLRNSLAANLLPRGEVEEALEHYGTALVLARELGDRALEGTVLHGLGKGYHQQGEIQRALSHYEAALDALPPDDRYTRPHLLHNLGVLTSVYFHDRSRGHELLAAARDLWPGDSVNQQWKLRSLSQLGRIAWEQGRPEEARASLEEALTAVGDDRCGRATHLARLALVEERDGRRKAADARLEEAFGTLGEGPCPRAGITVHLLAGLLAEDRGRYATALDRYEQGRDEAAGQNDRTRLADSLAGIARAHRALGRHRAALDASRRALAVFEEVRPTVLREDLRTAFFATAQDHFDFHIDLLTRLGSAEEAWVTAERARAQALRDLLIEGGAGLRRGADPDLVERERELQRRLNVLEKRRLDQTREPSAAKAEAHRREIEALVEELERVRGEFRRRSPAYAAVTAPEPISLDDVQEKLLDEDTVLLEYRLGEEASWAWTITRGSLRVFRLPPRAEIDAVAREAASWTSSLRWPGRNPPALCELTRLVLGPVAGELGSSRLVVVPDGALEAVSFAALPDPTDPAPCPEAAPLLAGHEIVYLPSASALATQRRLLANRRPAGGSVAVVADPVYGPGDERLRRPVPARPAASSSSSTSAADRLERLPHAGEEAAAVLAGLPRAKTFQATGFAASKQTVTGGAVGNHRIVHFATHGVLHDEQPLLSFLALARRGADGAPVDGELYAHEIYDLDLAAELVVLSACETALGRPVPGEGLVSGLPRAFLYAGAARVLVSLWPVPDRSTRDLMELFYRGLVAEGLPPGRALQEAQLSLRREGRPPYQWAGFVLQGDWRPLPPFHP